MRRAQPWLTNRARALRSKSSSAEERLWAELRDRRLQGLKFVRQAPIGSYYADFLCRERRIIVEVDGGTHSTEEEIATDAVRESYVKACGYRILHAHNTEIYDDIDGVLDSLLAFIDEGPRE